MNAIAVDETLLQALAKRYEPTVVPPCRVCGATLEVAAVGGGSPTRYACSTQSATVLPTDWDHYERSRWEDPRQGGDEAVMQLIAAYRILSEQASPASQQTKRPFSPKAQVKAMLPGRDVKRYRMVGGGGVFHQVELPGGQIIGKGTTPREAWENAHAWAALNATSTR